MEHHPIRDPETGETLVTIRTKNEPLAALRHLVSVANLAPNKYGTFDADGDHAGDAACQFSLRDTCMGSVDDATNVPKEAVIATACILDALENRKMKSQTLPTHTLLLVLH